MTPPDRPSLTLSYSKTPVLPRPRIASHMRQRRPTWAEQPGSEICETPVDLEVHHIRKLADLNKPGRRGEPA